jgi:uncharacterized protein YajQ (UPF0234 family)
MAAESSFDIVCKVDLQEVRNAIQHAMKEIQTRFDLKGTGTEIELVDDGVAIEIRSSEELKLKNGKDVLESKLVKRGVPLKALSEGKVESALGGTVRQKIELQAGIPMEKAKEIVKMVKNTKLKVQTAIRGIRCGEREEQGRSPVGDSLLKESELGIAMQYTNYR